MAERIYVALDLETTGLSADHDAIIEIGAVRFQGDRVLDRFSTVINPLRPIPLFIQQLTGIDDRDVMDAPVLDQVLPELLAFVDRGVHGVVAHNPDFDLGFLRAAGVNFHRPALDTFELATVLLPGLPGYSLGELCRVLDIALTDAHRALDDAEATAHLFAYLHERLLALPESTVAEIVHSGQGVDWSPLLLFEEALSHREQGSEVGAQGLPPSPAPCFPPPISHLPLSDRPPQTSSVHPVSLSDVTHYFVPDGPLARQMGVDYEMRDGQVEMARQVTQALNRGEHRLIEAGTGTGKSLAYLIPAALWSRANRQRVVIATNTIALQDQLLDKDIPQVQALLAAGEGEGSVQLQAALLKGRGNYLCTRRLHAWQHSRRLSPAELRLLAKVLVWLLDTQTGDVSGLFLADPAEQAAWSRICSDAATCTPERCFAPMPRSDSGPDAPAASRQHFRDFFWEARQRAEFAHLLVVNHALLLADISTGGRVLPPYAHLIVDEAHRLEEAATDQLTYRADQRYMEALLSALDLDRKVLALVRAHTAGARLADDLRGHARRATEPLSRFADTLSEFVRRQEGIQTGSKYVQRLGLGGGVRAQPRWSQVEIEWEDTSVELRMAERKLRALVTVLEEARWWQAEPQATHLSELQGLSARVTELVERLDEIIFQPGGVHVSNSVTWLELNPGDNALTFCVAPLYVGDLVESRLVHACRATVFTGATLHAEAGFDFIRDRLGLWDADATTIPSPFDYRRSTLLYMPSNLPEPDRAGYQRAVEEAIIQAAQAVGGHTMVLFTSHSHLRATAEAIRGPLDRLGITVLQHGSSSRRQLLLAYRNTERAVLLGTRSFWEGVDLAGDLLSCLLIVRLPFAVPTDPIVAARSAVFEDPFHHYTLPDAVLRFRQGFGRLIRRASDRGVVVLLDSRIWRKNYGKAFLDSLPPCTVRHGPLANLGECVAQWLYERQ